MPKRYREGVSLDLSHERASCQFEDGTVVEVKRGLLNESSLLKQTLSDAD